jgi:hypothetical protein
MESNNKVSKIAEELKTHLGELKIQWTGETPAEICEFGTKFCMSHKEKLLSRLLTSSAK